MSYDLHATLRCNVCLLLHVGREMKGEYSDIDGLLASTKVSRCSGCQLESYCGRDHQMWDWSLHRPLCRGIQRIMRRYGIRHAYLISGQPKDAYTFERATLQVKYLLRTSLKRPLQFHEDELTSFPPHCAVCYSLERLHPCQRCYAVSYCSKQHAAEHSARHIAQCGLLQIYYSPYKVHPPPPPEKIVKVLHHAVPNMIYMDLIDAFQYVTGLQLPARPVLSRQDYQLYACAADFSCIGTICFTLAFLDMAEFGSSKFVIFIVGATIEQDLWFREIHTRFFFMQYPLITRLELYFIGPDVLPSERREMTYTLRGVERVIEYNSHKQLFEDFAKDQNIKPSIIVAFNCGFSEHSPHTSLVSITDAGDIICDDEPLQDTWSEAILEMLQTYHLPIVFTSFTSLEAEFDYAAVLRVAHSDRLEASIEQLFDIKKNPYRDFRPLRNWQLGHGDEIFYRNGYVQAVTSRLRK